MVKDSIVVRGAREHNLKNTRRGHLPRMPGVRGAW